MADATEASGWVSIGEAARALGVGKGAIRKRIEAGTLASRDDAGSTKVLLPFATPAHANAAPNSTPESKRPVTGDVSADADARSRALAADHEECSAADADLAVRVAALTERAAQLAARLADAQAERDRWLAAAVEARSDTRAAVAARDEAERELRLLLARAQFEPALPAAAASGRDAPEPPAIRRRWQFWRR